jgi:hypothetical protein
MGRRGNVTLMCHCGDEEHTSCHVKVFAKILSGKI